MDRQGHRMASCTTSGSIAIFDISSGQIELAFDGRHRDVFKIDLSSDGALLAESEPRGVRMYELSDERLATRAKIRLKHSVIDLNDCSQYLGRTACDEDLKEAGR
jgi:hypothetical protein